MSKELNLATFRESADGTRRTKSDAILSLLRSEQGATLDELLAMTGWQPNSIRGFIATAKRSGYRISSLQDADGKRRYRISA